MQRGTVAAHIYAVLGNRTDYLNLVSPNVFKETSHGSSGSTSSTNPSRTRKRTMATTQVARRQTRYDPYINQSHSTMSLLA